ncbi:MAG: bifunctional phosphopantothenoylcysteine decarboxylase/phosphopantothenate--cysteine ligase CoaBC [Bacteroidota bacterium]
MLSGKHIILGVTGGIAAYKSALLVRDIVRAGADVQVVMTKAATHFITPLTLSTLSRREVVLEMFPVAPEEPTTQWTTHIDLGVWADLMLIAPASANTIAKIAHGFSDNFLTTLVLALRGPLVLSPSMDVDMWQNETTQKNIDRLRQSGCHIIPPEAGELASGLNGPGRLPDTESIVRFVDGVLERVHQDLRGKRVLVTAGPTQEPIDPVRYVGNRSSGKMGFALAGAAAQRGAEVTLVSGPVSLHTPRNTRRIDVTTTEEMSEAVQREFSSVDLVLMAAAVADFTPVKPFASKVKREALEGDVLTLQLRKNPDILKGVAERKTNQILVGFALETENEVDNARRKLKEKKLDMVALNNPHEAGAGFGSDTNVVTILSANGDVEKLSRMAKCDVANEILNRVALLLSS